MIKGTAGDTRGEQMRNAGFLEELAMRWEYIDVGGHSWECGFVSFFGVPQQQSPNF